MSVRVAINAFERIGKLEVNAELKEAPEGHKG